MSEPMPTYQFSTAKTSVQPRRNEHGVETDFGVTVQSGNGTTYYGELPGGTPIGIIAASGLARPCGKTTVKTTGAALTTVEVNEGNNFFIGDVVEFLDGATGALIAAKTLTNVVKTGATHSVTFAGAINVTAGDVVHLDPNTATMAGAGTAVGALTANLNTFNKDLGPLGGYANQGAVVAWHGHFYDAKLVGGNALIKADLPACRFD